MKKIKNMVILDLTMLFIYYSHRTMRSTL